MRFLILLLVLGLSGCQVITTRTEHYVPISVRPVDRLVRNEYEMQRKLAGREEKTVSRDVLQRWAYDAALATLSQKIEQSGAEWVIIGGRRVIASVPKESLPSLDDVGAVRPIRSHTPIFNYSKETDND